MDKFWGNQKKKKKKENSKKLFPTKSFSSPQKLSYILQLFVFQG